jgi:hypothetical protein
MNKKKPYPILLWGLIGLLSAVGIFVVTPLLPWRVGDLEPHKRLVQAVFFTACAFVVWVSFFWRWRRLGAFWVSVCMFLLLHVLCVILYSTFVQPILVWQWSFILFVEFYAAAFFIEWFTRRLSRSKPAERDY